MVRGGTIDQVAKLKRTPFARNTSDCDEGKNIERNQSDSRTVQASSQIIEGAHEVKLDLIRVSIVGWLSEAGTENKSAAE